ncbi:MAG TPA: biopolymer transporter ExbD, partial [Brevundimonas sp.]|uniref:ExbD/TolR family protein n=1 Tax=Brevundimonas sp. TaxID=1871086 RepID=UPI002C9F13EC
PTFILLALGGRIFVATGEGVPAEVTLEGLDSELFTRLGARDERVMIRADADVPYNDFMTVMNDLQSRGWLQVGLINEDIE